METQIRKIWNTYKDKNTGDLDPNDRLCLLFTICLMLYRYKNAYFDGYDVIIGEGLFRYRSDKEWQIKNILKETGLLDSKIFMVSVENPRNINHKTYLLFNKNISPEEATIAVQGETSADTSRTLGNVLDMQCSGDITAVKDKLFKKSEDIFYKCSVNLHIPDQAEYGETKDGLFIYGECCVKYPDLEKLEEKAKQFNKIAKILDKDYKIQYYILKLKADTYGEEYLINKTI